MAQKEIDQATGIETTGHVWDGDLKELNKPLPKWWLWTFYASILWSIGYWIAYPAWPTMAGYTKGMLGYSQREVVTNEVKAGKAAQAQFREALAKTPLADVRKNPDLLRFATTGGKSAFAENCAPCHGRGAQGFTGYPNLNDDDWLWGGGKIEEIEKTILYGIRSDHKQSRSGDMPKNGDAYKLTPAQINDVADYVLSLSGKGDKAAAERGKKVFTENCVTCHGDNGKGNQDLGAPNLTDGIWLYGSSKEAIAQTITNGRGGVMPAWEARFKNDPVTIKSLAVYVHSLGGGK